MTAIGEQFDDSVIHGVDAFLRLGLETMRQAEFAGIVGHHGKLSAVRSKVSYGSHDGVYIMHFGNYAGL